MMVLNERVKLSHLFLAQLDLTLFDNVFFVQQLLLLTFKVILALRKKIRRKETTLLVYSYKQFK